MLRAEHRTPHPMAKSPAAPKRPDIIRETPLAEALGEPQRLAAIRRQAHARAEARLAPVVVGAQLRQAFQAAGVAHV